jgi:hypothetical protein
VKKHRWLALCALVWGSCTPTKGNPPDSAAVSQALERHADSLMRIPGVVGTAEGSCAGRPCVLVLVERLTPALQKAIPPVLEGIPVEVRETGRIRAND